MDASARWKFGDFAWLIAWAALSSAACLSVACKTGATFDEPLHIVRGMGVWRTGSHEGLMRLGAMPLALDLYTLPLYLWERCRGVPFDLTHDVELLLPWFRLGPLLFWWLLLTYGLLCGRLLAGPWGGRIAVALLSCEPTLLAHASLGGTDIAVTACLLALVYHFRLRRTALGWRRWLGSTLWYGAAVLAKASALVLGPLCLVVIELERLWSCGCFRRPTEGGWRDWLRQGWRDLALLRRDLRIILAGGLTLVMLFCGCDFKPLPSFMTWAQARPEGSGKDFMVWLAGHLAIFSNGAEGLVRQVSHNLRGHGVYLLGRAGPRWFWYYFPTALSIKLPVPVLIAPLIVAVLHRRALGTWATITAAALLVFSLNCHVQIGVRLMMPLIVLLLVGLAGAAVRTFQELAPGWRRRTAIAAAGLSLLWIGLTPVLSWPNWLCYCNEAWGGTSKGYLCLSDSNYDWGQGLPELGRWQQAHGEAPLDVWYFGTDPILERLPIRSLHFERESIRGFDDVAAQVHGHYLAVGTTLVYGSYGQLHRNESMQRMAAVLRALAPVARTTTFLIYDFRSFNRDPKGSGGAERSPSGRG